MLKYHIIFKNGRWLSIEINDDSIQEHHKNGVSPLQHAIRSACFSLSQKEEDIVSILAQEFN